LEKKKEISKNKLELQKVKDLVMCIQAYTLCLVQMMNIQVIDGISLVVNIDHDEGGNGTSSSNPQSNVE
jgi:hypothetical protein